MSDTLTKTSSVSISDNIVGWGAQFDQCLRKDKRCDAQFDCLDKSDEITCGDEAYDDRGIETFEAIPPPALVNFNTLSFLDSMTITPMRTDENQSAVCPETHFKCPPDGYCLPVYVICNGVDDCPGREDEAACDSYTCPGFYRCRGSRICLHASQVCDLMFHCPQRDDELFCDLSCPESCTCHGMAFFCNQTFPVMRYPDLRYLDARGSFLSPRDLKNNTMLIFLGLSACGVQVMDDFVFPNLHALDLSNNEIADIRTTHLVPMPKLQVLFFSGNPLVSLFIDGDKKQSLLPALNWLDLSLVKMREINVTVLSPFPNLAKLNFSGSGVDTVEKGSLQTVTKLRVLDVRGCPLTQIPQDLFRGLDNLQDVLSDNFKLCCPAMLPTGFNFVKCVAEFDEISSCDALLRSDLYRVILSIFATLALVGNVGSFFTRTFVFKKGGKSGYAVFVTHLSLSDFMMGVYLAIIGIADRVYVGTYLWNDVAWKHSVACKLAGFLSLVSSEVSAFIVCLITVDRFIVLRFPFSSLRFGKRSALVACLLTWIVGVVIAAFPFTPAVQHWQFYSQTGICIPLPITRQDFAGHYYSFGVMIILNFVLFVLIASGQAFIFFSIRANRMALSDGSRQSMDTTIARRLITVAMTDFLCWFPIGLLAMLAAQGVPVPGEVNVAMAIIALPLNSALNPFLYNLNMLLENRQKVREETLLRSITSQMEQESLED